jgi:hypothetical protein
MCVDVAVQDSFSASSNKCYSTSAHEKWIKVDTLQKRCSLVCCVDAVVFAAIAACLSWNC